MICIEAYRSAVGLWQNSSGKIQNHHLAKENKEGDSFGYSEQDPNVKKTRRDNHKKKRGKSKRPTFNTCLRICILIIATTVLISSLSENSDMSLLRTQIQILLLRAGIEWNPGPKRLRNPMSIICEYCGAQFTRNTNLHKHIERFHKSSANIICRFCQSPFDSFDHWNEHMNTAHKPRTSRWQVSNQAFDGKVMELTLFYKPDKQRSLEKALGNQIETQVRNQIVYYRRLHGTIRYQLSIVVMMAREGLEGEIIDSWYFQNDSTTLHSGELGISDTLSQEFSLLRQRIMEYETNQKGSGWRFVSAEAITIKITKLSSKTFGKHLKFIPRNKKGNVLKTFQNQTINVKNNEDNKCVIYNIILSKFAQHITRDPSNPRNLEYFMKYINDKNVEYPVRESDLKILEDNNKENLNIAINVWMFYSANHIEPYYISKNISSGRTECNMILIQRNHQIKEETTRHLIHVKNLDALFRETLGTGQQRSKFFCDSCKLFKTCCEKKMIKHFKQCSDRNYFKKILPPYAPMHVPEGNLLPPPHSYKSSIPVLRGFFDFETLHHPRTSENCEICLKKLVKLGCRKTVDFKCDHTNKKQSFLCTELPPICFSLIIIDQEGQKMFEKIYSGLDAAEVFINLLIEKEPDFLKFIDRNMELRMTPRNWTNFESSDQCYECKITFSKATRKCRDHDHFTGRYRGALCNFCNLQKKTRQRIPLYCHNLSGFDSHLIIKALQIKSENFSVLSRNEEKIISMDIGKFRLIDSISFMPQRLDTLVENLKMKDPTKFIQTYKLANKDPAKIEIFLGKGIFPYEYLTDESKLQDTSLPPIEEFYSTLKESDVTVEDYKKAKEVWKKFKCQSLREYMELYCRSDTHLLADVWKNFCDVTSYHLTIHPEADYISLPSYAFDCFKNRLQCEQKTNISVIDSELEIFHNDVATGIRGGSCMINQKVAFDSAMKNRLIKEANKEELKEYEEIQSLCKKLAEENSKKIVNEKKTKYENTNPEFLSNYKFCGEPDCTERISKNKIKCLQHKRSIIMAFDANNLYGATMTQKMPLNNFIALDQEDIKRHQDCFDNIRNKKDGESLYPQASSKGYIFCTQLKFSEEVQKKLLSYPLVPEQLIVEENMLSEGQKKTWSKLFQQDYSSCNHKKMVNSFATKKEYTSHYRMLIFLRQMGVEVKILRGYSFHQTNFISSYVKFCSNQRKESTNAADKDLWKLMANIIYGKFIGELLFFCLYI